MKVAAGLSYASAAGGEDKLWGCECLTSTEFIVAGIRIDSWNDAQSANVVHLKGETEVTRPTNRTEHNVAFILLGGFVQSEFKEGFRVHGCTCAQLRVNYLFSCGELYRFGLSFLCPIAMVRGQEVLGCVKVKHRATIAPQGYRILLVMAYLRPSLDHVLLVVSGIVQLYGVRVFIVLQGDDRFRSTVNGLCLYAFIVKVSGHVAVSMGNSHSGFKIVFVARPCIDFMAARTYCAV